ncbi:hypothetical protein [Paenibacillus cremeus]|uniref:Sporulation membrane protein YtrI C-terminal domain-containing protein n=1 Tax=Paenibacillus cremeus TaxID=2163881 RepID=A0A559K5L6_9BACL|nr:hypothetical protein [Paenibacillus cremeus]TVY07422.1 hypothetical protein FPZ49_23980 [Paenibacillus cremeus]
MPPEKAEQTGSVLRYVGLVIAGMVIGAALFMSIYHQQLSFMIEQNHLLRTENNKQADEISDLKKSKNQQSTINLLNIYVEGADHTVLDKLAEAELKRRIHTDLRKVVIGRKISNFAENPDVYEQILVQKPYLGVMDKDYIVQNVKWMVVTQTELKIWVTVKEWKRLPVS